MKYNPLRELIIARMREFRREPEAIFWVYVFPVLLMAGLGIAFRGGGSEEIGVDVAAGSEAEKMRAALAVVKGFKVEVMSLEEAHKRYTAGKTDVIVERRGDSYHYVYDASVRA